MSFASFLKTAQSQTGSALLMALAGVAMVGLMASAAITLTSLMNDNSQKAAAKDAVTAFAQAIETIATNSQACIGTSGPTQLDGLRFNYGGTLSQTCDSTCLGTGSGAAGALNVALDSKLSGSLPGRRSKYIMAGNTFQSATQNTNIAVDSFYLSNVAPDPLNPGTYSGDLYLKVHTVSPSIQFAPRLIGHVTMMFGGTTLFSCSSTASPEMLCASMNCVYDSTSPTQKCFCGFPAMDCNDGAHPPPRWYIAGINPDMTPICKQVQLTCPTGLFISGIDNSGNPICLAAEGSYGSPPPPCPSQAVTWMGCSGTVATTTASSTSAPVTATSGGTGSATFTCNASGAWVMPALPGATCAPPPPNCPAGTLSWMSCNGPVTSTPSGSSAPVSASAPYSGSAMFACNSGSWASSPNPGATCILSCPAGTATTNTGGVSSVAGCYCPSGQTWGGSSCSAAPICPTSGNTHITSIKYCANTSTGNVCYTDSSLPFGPGYGPRPPMPLDPVYNNFIVTFNWDMAGTPVSCVTPPMTTTSGSALVECGGYFTMNVDFFNTGTPLSSTWTPGGFTYTGTASFGVCPPPPPPPPSQTWHYYSGLSGPNCNPVDVPTVSYGYNGAYYPSPATSCSGYAVGYNCNSVGSVSNGGPVHAVCESP